MFRFSAALALTTAAAIAGCGGNPPAPTPSDAAAAQPGTVDPSTAAPPAPSGSGSATPAPSPTNSASPTPAPVATEDACGASKIAPWIGKEATVPVRIAVAKAAGSKRDRWLYPDSIVTMDYSATRLNVTMEKGTDIIVSARCG